jgi:hypothetical protein
MTGDTFPRGYSYSTNGLDFGLIFGTKRWCPHPQATVTLRQLPIGPAWLCSGCRIEWDEEGTPPVTQDWEPTPALVDPSPDLTIADDDLPF